MSMPKFPEFDPEITCTHALNMVLVSIAMEELALSHIINAEGEKLQYVLRALEKSCGRELAIDEVLSVNQSITNLLDSVSQNQMILKNKMDKALHALAEVCSKEEIGKSLCNCSAVFKAEKKGQLWCEGSALRWGIEHLRGKCICQDPCDKTKIGLRSKRQFMVSFAVNVRTKSAGKCVETVSISLQMTNHQPRKDIYTVRSPAPHDDTTISMGGIIVETSEHDAPSALSLKLISSDSLIVESAILNVMEI